MNISTLTAEKYHADPAPHPSLSSSIANVLITQSPQHAWLAHPRLNPSYKRDTDSRFDLGSAAHMMLLERRDDGIVVIDAEDWRTKAAKERREEAQAAGKFPILYRHYEDVLAMVVKARAFLNGTELCGILESGKSEHTLLWHDGADWFRCRPDVLADDFKVVLDYKSTGSASHEAFGKQIGRMGYDLQAEFYARGVQAVTGVEPVFVFLAQEIDPPYACSLTALSNAYRAVGQAKVRQAIKLWHTCMESGLWPAYTSQIAYAEPTPWQVQLPEDWT